MDKRTNSPALERPERHHDRNLPRSWITLPAPIQRRAHADPLLRGLFPSHVGYFPRARSHTISRATGLTSTIFNYCVKGRGWCTLTNTRFEARPGDIMVVPAGEPHAYGSDPDDPWTVHWFHAMGANVPRLLEHLGVRREAPIVHVGRSAQLEALFAEMREALEDDYSEQRLLYAAQTLAHLMGVMIRLHLSVRHRQPTASQRVASTLQHVKGRLAAAHTVPELAALAELSPSRYSELVRSSTGYSPKEYVMRLRMHRAAQLLDTTELPVKAIALEVGFADPLHFSRAFRRINEQSPRGYRQRATALPGARAPGASQR
jgi:AraC family transcriptional regulator, arabinose operon regulatory protein